MGALTPAGAFGPWMCAMFTLLVDVKPVSDTLKSIVLACELMVMTAVPRAPLSALVIGGFSFCADNGTVKTVMLLGAGVLLLLPHPAAPMVIATAIASRLICPPWTVKTP
jgi:hypothetical protein